MKKKIKQKKILKRYKNKYDDHLRDDVLTPNPLDLVKEWAAQPKLYMFWAEKLDEAEDEADAAKRNKSLVEAQVEKMVRDDPDEFGIDKVTDKAIAMSVVRHKHMQEAEEELQSAVSEVRHLKSMIKALSIKKEAIENMVRMHGQKYFAMPHVVGIGQEVAEEITKQSVRKQRERKAR